MRRPNFLALATAIVSVVWAATAARGADFESPELGVKYKVFVKDAMPKGLEVTDVTDNSPAAKAVPAPISVGNIILSVGSDNPIKIGVKSKANLDFAISTYKSRGQPTDVTVQTAAGIRVRKVTLGSRVPSGSPPAKKDADAEFLAQLGLTLEQKARNKVTIKDTKTFSGVLSDAQAKLTVGQQIFRVEGKTIKTIKQLVEIVKTTRKTKFELIIIPGYTKKYLDITGRASTSTDLRLEAMYVPWFGLIVEDVDAGSKAEYAGLKKGDVITSLASDPDTPVESTALLDLELQGSKTEVKVNVVSATGAPKPPVTISKLPVPLERDHAQLAIRYRPSLGNKAPWRVSRPPANNTVGAVLGLKVGDQLHTVFRSGKSAQDVDKVLADWPDVVSSTFILSYSRPPSKEKLRAHYSPALGIAVTQDTKGGLKIVGVKYPSKAKSAGFKLNDVVRFKDARKTTSLFTMERDLQTTGKVDLRVLRGGSYLSSPPKLALPLFRVTVDNEFAGLTTVWGKLGGSWYKLKPPKGTENPFNPIPGKKAGAGAFYEDYDVPQGTIVTVTNSAYPNREATINHSTITANKKLTVRSSGKLN